jgi:hypothetical protein
MVGDGHFRADLVLKRNGEVAGASAHTPVHARRLALPVSVATGIDVVVRASSLWKDGKVS